MNLLEDLSKSKEDPQLGKYFKYFSLLWIASVGLFSLLFVFFWVSDSRDYWGYIDPLEYLCISFLGFIFVIGILSFCFLCLLILSRYIQDKLIKRKIRIFKFIFDIGYVIFNIFLYGGIILIVFYVDNNSRSIFERSSSLDSKPTINERSGSMPISNTILGMTSEDLEARINEYRSTKNLKKLDRYEPLCDLAKIRVHEIKSDWSHAGFENRKSDELYDKFCNSNTLTCTRMGENLAKDFTRASDVMNGWIYSRGHLENIVGNYNVQCVIVDDGFVVSLFASASNYVPNATTTGSQVLQYDYESVKSWEELISSDKRARDSWEDGLNDDWYPKSRLERLINKFDERIDVEEDIWDGLTNSKLTQNEFNRLQEKVDNLHLEIETLVDELNDSHEDNCREYYEEDDMSEDEIDERCD